MILNPCEVNDLIPKLWEVEGCTRIWWFCG